ncbi:uncharacterized protein TRAVEDRAFT_60229 [Trametes versicolor FP-101664 SS1]|uniref:uncharacterized protein n=1 Tax=Trametes versicolor (strain FP-101664) TaxID=717944 RepID=UPI0004623C14|nr:uncharacterized protein TRAVEDRAFT_60229 [Trametes versicolor FP-101664 SS1]EIW54782.1 hypothetical protein TRAVEDRAFT_60229 [Trametes versicolor FP-101664 SS1]
MSRTLHKSRSQHAATASPSTVRLPRVPSPDGSKLYSPCPLVVSGSRAVDGPLQDRSELSWAVPSAGVSRHSRRSRISSPPFSRAGSAFALGAFQKNITAVYQPPARARALTLRPLVRRSSCRRHSEVTPPQAVICHNSGDSCGLSRRGSRSGPSLRYRRPNTRKATGRPRWYAHGRPIWGPPTKLV